MLDEIRVKLGALSENDFEMLCCQLLPAEFPEYIGIEPQYNLLGKTTQGTPDAHLLLPNGTYVAFQFTTQQTGIKLKVIQDISKLASEKCHIRNKISEVVICLNTPLGSEVEIYRQEAAKYGWHIKVFSLETLSKITLKHPTICYEYLRVRVAHHKDDASVSERFFDCGERIKIVREELGLSISQLIENIDYFSEKQFAQIENRQEEAPISLLTKICKFSGANLEWLKHGIENKYVSTSLRFYPVQRAIKQIKELEPIELHFCLEDNAYNLLLAAKLSDYNWRIIHVGFSLDLWKWIDDFHYIPDIYDFINQVHEEFHSIVDSYVLSPRMYSDLLQSKVHPIKILSNANYKKNWADDIRDIYHRYPIAEDYQNWYGDWFIKVQALFKKYINEYRETRQKKSGANKS